MQKLETYWVDYNGLTEKKQCWITLSTQIRQWRKQDEVQNGVATGHIRSWKWVGSVAMAVTAS